MTEKVQLVPVTNEEREEFTRMAIQHFCEVNPEFVPQEDWQQHYVARIMRNPDLSLCWIRVDGKNAGFILYGMEDHRFLPRKSGTLYELYVRPEFRRQGLARAAGVLAIRNLGAFSPSKIQLEIQSGNAAAAALWTSLGFRRVTERYVRQGESH